MKLLIVENGRPFSVVHSLLPLWNSFVFFEVVPTSYHQVAEVLSQSKTRLSINGWFHGDPITRPERYLEPAPPRSSIVDLAEKTIRKWINPTYLEDSTQLQIKEEFKDLSEISLSQFLNENCYLEVARALKDCETIEWKSFGPANIACYALASISSLPSSLKELNDLFHSEAMFLILSNMTGLKLHELVTEESDSDDDDDDQDGQNGKRFDPYCRGEIRKWSKKCYTLINDNSLEAREGCAIDVMLFFNCDEEINRDEGGFVSYIAKNEDEELLTIEPQSNCLNIVYRDEKCLRFVKYINDAFQDEFHDMSFSYFQH